MGGGDPGLLLLLFVLKANYVDFKLSQKKYYGLMIM